MDGNSFPPNPYDPKGETLPPFAGREQAFSRLHNHLGDPPNTKAATFVGRRHIGKSALLQRFAVSTDSGYIGVYLPLLQMPLHEEEMWLYALAQTTIDTVVAHGFSLDDLVIPQDDMRATRQWFTEQCLPTIFRVIRPKRRLLLLLDDAQRLMKEAEELNVSRDSFAYLHGLLDPQLGIALTIDLRYEDDLDLFFPLVEPNNVHRLTSLGPEDCAAVIRSPAQGLYSIADDAMAAIYKATGGEPALLQRFGYHLYERARGGHTSIKPDDVKAATPTVYAESEGEFQVAWRALSRDERLVLTALSGLLYQDPLKTIQTSTIENWLVETDYPMDATAINAAIRGLEYREIVQGTAADVQMTSGLMQKWLLENALLGIDDTMPTSPVAQRRWTTWVIIALVVVIIVAIAIGVSLSRAPGGGLDDTPVPTITLESG